MERYEKLGVKCFSAEARVLSPYEICIGEKIILQKALVIATGARPKVIPFKGLDQISYLTSDNIWQLKHCPQRLVVLGGGPIGCELAQCFQRFGSQVTIVDLAPRIVFRLDEKVSDILSHKFYEEGMQILTSHQVEKFVVNHSGEKSLVVKDQQGRKKTFHLMRF